MKDDMKRTSRASRARRAQQRKRRNRRIALTLCVMFVVLAASIGGTVAWLTDKTGPIENTFTYGDINIKLTETNPADNKATIVPGVDIGKDPKVTVEAGSEACWLFVKVEETGRFVANKVTYSIADGWTKLDGVEGVNDVYYREVSADDAKAGKEYYVLAGDTTYHNGVVKVSDNLTKTEVENLADAKLTFTAYAVQKTGINDAATAWTKVAPTTTP